MFGNFSGFMCFSSFPGITDSFARRVRSPDLLLNDIGYFCVHQVVLFKDLHQIYNNTF